MKCTIVITGHGHGQEQRSLSNMLIKIQCMVTCTCHGQMLEGVDQAEAACLLGRRSSTQVLPGWCGKGDDRRLHPVNGTHSGVLVLFLVLCGGALPFARTGGLSCMLAPRLELRALFFLFFFLL